MKPAHSGNNVGAEERVLRPAREGARTGGAIALGEHDMGANMRRILSATGQKVPESKPTLELNVEHPLVKYLESVGDEGQFK